MENHYIPITNTNTTKNNGDNILNMFSSTSCTITLRLVFVFLISIISIWANYEASKGFDITILNDLPKTHYGRKFHVLYASNGKANRIILKTSKFAEEILYPDSTYQKKTVKHITLQLSSQNLTDRLIINTRQEGHYFIKISRSVLEEANIEEAIVSTIQRAMMHVWLWDANGHAPRSLQDGMVEFISITAGFSSPIPYTDSELDSPESYKVCWKNKDPLAVAHFLSYREGMQKGFIGRLNQVLKDPWHAQMVDDALGLPSQQLCESYISKTIEVHKPLSMDHASSINIE